MVLLEIENGRDYALDIERFSTRMFVRFLGKN